MAPPLIQESGRVRYKGGDESFPEEGGCGVIWQCLINAASPEDTEQAAPSESEESGS